MKFSAIVLALATLAFCDGAENLRGRELLADIPDKVIASYIGAYPGGTPPPRLADIPAGINLLMLSFAKDPNLDGNFVAFNGWSTNLNPSDIQADRARNPGRRYLVSVGGDASSGGTFAIKSDISDDEWVNNAFNSISSIIETYNLDGYEAQWEGGVTNSRFIPCLNALHQKFKNAQRSVAVGPFYGGTSSQYGLLNLDTIDIVNMQMYATGATSVQAVIDQSNKAMNQFGGADKVAKKFVFGANSNYRAPAPSPALDAFQQLYQTYNIRGGFTWDIEHSGTSTNPQYCLENNFDNIMDGKERTTCEWGTPPAPVSSTTRCGSTWTDANLNCYATCTTDAQCSGGLKCFADLQPC